MGTAGPVWWDGGAGRALSCGAEEGAVCSPLLVLHSGHWVLKHLNTTFDNKRTLLIFTTHLVFKIWRAFVHRVLLGRWKSLSRNSETVQRQTPHPWTFIRKAGFLGSCFSKRLWPFECTADKRQRLGSELNRPPCWHYGAEPINLH